MSLSVPDRYMEEFEISVNQINVTRGKITAISFILIECVILLIFSILKRKDFFTLQNLLYAAMYLVMILIMILFLLILDKFQKNILAYGRQIKIVGMLFACFILYWCAIIALMDLKSSGQITVYTVAIISIAVAPYYKPTTLLFIYLSAQIPFLFLLPYFQKFNGISNYINSSAFVAIALAISFMRFKKQIHEFNNEKIIQQKSEDLERINKELEEANQKLEKLSRTDGLTGVCNRSMFDITIESEWNTCKRYSKPLSLIMIDIDLFKAFNDNYGHQAGDRCIQRVAEVLVSCAKRSADTVARYGGEEFAVILPYTEKKNASILAEKIRKKVEGLAISHAYSAVSECVTISLGVNTVIPSDEFSVEEFIRATDTALYDAKINRNHFVVAENTKPEPITIK